MTRSSQGAEDIPGHFIERIRQVHGAKGAAWLESISHLIAYAENRWRFSCLPPFELSYNYVAPVIFDDASQGVLKLMVPGEECDHQIKTLTIYHGSTMCELIGSDAERGILVLEKLIPGLTLKTITQEDTSVKIAAELIRDMAAKHKNGIHPFPTISKWHERLYEAAAVDFPEGVKIQERTLSRAKRLSPKLCSKSKNPYLLHGDFHHDNILLAGERWKLIDPKGVIGEMACEVIPFLMNNITMDDAEAKIKRRATQFANLLDLDLNRIYGWGLCHSVLSAYWNLDDNVAIPQETILVIEIFDHLARD